MNSFEIKSVIIVLSVSLFNLSFGCLKELSWTVLLSIHSNI